MFFFSPNSQFSCCHCFPPRAPAIISEKVVTPQRTREGKENFKISTAVLLVNLKLLVSDENLTFYEKNPSIERKKATKIYRYKICIK